MEYQITYISLVSALLIVQVFDALKLNNTCNYKGDPYTMDKQEKHITWSTIQLLDVEHAYFILVSIYWRW
jgi:hypothetical protein